MNDRLVSRLLWATFAAAIVVLGWQFEDRLEMLFATRGQLTVSEEGDVVRLRWRGAIEAPFAARLDEAFRDNRHGRPRFLISLASPGGDLAHGGEVIRVIRQMQRTHQVDTVVEGRSVCASMCVAIYLAGRERTAAPGARFMFHEVSFRDSHSDKVETVPKKAIARATDHFFERYLRSDGVDPAWLGRMREQIRGRDVWRRAEDLVAERSGIVQRLE